MHISLSLVDIESNSKWTLIGLFRSLTIVKCTFYFKFVSFFMLRKSKLLSKYHMNIYHNCSFLQWKFYLLSSARNQKPPHFFIDYYVHFLFIILFYLSRNQSEINLCFFTVYFIVFSFVFLCVPFRFHFSWVTVASSALKFYLSPILYIVSFDSNGKLKLKKNILKLSGWEWRWIRNDYRFTGNASDDDPRAAWNGAASRTSSQLEGCGRIYQSHFGDRCEKWRHNDHRTLNALSYSQIDLAHNN